MMGKYSKIKGYENTSGVAPKAKLHSYDWTDDHLEMLKEAKQLNVSNHSYGYIAGVRYIGGGVYFFLGKDEDSEDFHYGWYASDDYERDAITYTNPEYLQVWVQEMIMVNQDFPKVPLIMYGTEVNT